MTTKILLIASNNPGKIKEIKEILKGIPFEIKSLNNIGEDIEVEETGKTFEENAILKAKTFGEKTGMLTLADDSGLEVDALGGKPGIYSARYEVGTDLDRINKLLKELKGVPREKRTARFRAVVALFIPRSVIPTKPEGRVEGSLGLSELAFARPARQCQVLAGGDSSTTPSTSSGFARNDDFKIVIFKGVSEGYITDRPIGNNGFGYDPIFFNQDLGKTNAEVTLEEKNSVSHRTRALRKAREILLSFFKI